MFNGKAIKVLSRKHKRLQKMLIAIPIVSCVGGLGELK